MIKQIIDKIKELNETSHLSLNAIRDTLRDEHNIHISILPHFNSAGTVNFYSFEISNFDKVERGTRSSYYKALYSSLKRLEKMV